MTFRPSDDVLDEIASGQSPSLLWTQYNVPSQNEEGHIFNNTQENQWDSQNFSDSSDWNTNPVLINIPKEEVKAPDLSELLKKNWNNETDEKSSESNPWTSQSAEQSIPQTENIANNSSISTDSEKTEKTAVNPIQEPHSNLNTNSWPQNISIAEKPQTDYKQPDYVDTDKILDEERVKIVSSIPWAINSNLDYLVDRNWLAIIKKYKVVNRLFFRWWIFIFAVIVGILGGVLLQVMASSSNNVQMMDDSSIENKWKWIEETPDKKLAELSDKGIDINTIVPYGSVSLDEKTVQSKSNLIKYKWVVLPQLISLDYNSQNFISLEDFHAQKTTREDIKNLINVLITNDSIYRKTTNLPNVEEFRWIWNTLESSLIDGFSLWCLDSDKVSDFVCDKFLDVFYAYGKYFDLSKYSDELLKLMKDVKKQKKDTEPICMMIKDYTLRAGVISDSLLSIMEYCTDDYESYKKMVNFIDLENSLKQPELSDKIFDDPDLNAYKLLSAQQSVHKILDGTSLNENYIKSYLNFVQNLINKDNKSNHYLQPLYKDLVYVFNMDELYQKLMQKWKLSSELKIQIDQINNWNSIYWYSSLISQLTTKDLVQKGWDLAQEVVKERTIEEIFSQYYAMTDRLKIRSAKKVSEEEIKVQTEMFTDKILSATNWETLKVTVGLRKQDNLLYVDTIKVANQSKFTDILSLYASEWNITFYAMMNYIDEQIAMRYEIIPEDVEEQPTFCENLQEMEDISIYTCDDTSISLYKWEVEYNFTLENWVLDSFTIGDENLNKSVKDRLWSLMFTKDNTPTIIMSIIEFDIEENDDDNIEKKLSIVDQFRIHFKLVPDNIESIEWNDEEFLVDFTLWEFELQGNYNINTHQLTKIYYTNCEKKLEIRQLTIEISAENEPQLIEILNNPKVFFARVNPAAYKKYQKTCQWNWQQTSNDKKAS